VAQKTEQPPTPEHVDLKDRVLAGILAWLVPGLGHLYQGRWAKGILYMVCILGTFVWGLYLSSSAATGPARAVYVNFAFPANDWRLYYFGQIGIGLPALPALVQAVRVSDDKEPLWNGFMAPPRLESDGDNSPAHCTLADVNGKLNRYFEFATVYTLIAGLLNILAVYDACCGPVVSVPQEKKD
jgi:TM2 domain-containing membrane protein YozV